MSLLGWFLAIRGVLLLTVPQAYNAAGNVLCGPGAYAAVRVLFLCLGLAGLYLTYAGWKPESEAEAELSPIEDRRHAAGD